MIMASSNRPLLDVCDGQTNQLLQVERMRDAILCVKGLSLSRPRLIFNAPSPMHAPADAEYGPRETDGQSGRPVVRGPPGGVGMGRGIRAAAASSVPGMMATGVDPAQCRYPPQPQRGDRVGASTQYSRQEVVQQEAHAYTHYHFGAPRQLLY